MLDEVAVQDLLDAGSDLLSLEPICGERFLKRKIPEIAMNRPGLALAGFFRYFAEKRIQIFGMAEFSYLKDLTPAERFDRLQAVFDRRVPALVITRNRKVLPEMIELSRQYRVPVLRTPMVTMKFINECTVLLEKLTAPHERVQGTAMEVMGIGVLLRGEPGIGKSETALSLIERGYCLVSDDVTEIRRTSRGRIVCWANALTRYHMEIRGIGIIHVPSLFGIAAIRRQTELDVVVDLVSCKKSEDERAGVEAEYEELMGTKIPLAVLPVRSGRDMANVIEVVALNQKLKELGHDAAKELDERIINRLTKGRFGHG